MYVLLTSMDMDMDMDMSIHRSRRETDRQYDTYLPVPVLPREVFRQPSKYIR